MRTRAANFITILLLAAASGCDYIDDPVQQFSGNGGGEGVTRRVLLEDLTGHTCPNCPAATEVAFQLQDFYGDDKVIIVGVHVTEAFAAPVPPIGDGDFDYDLRTPAGDEYVTDFGVTFLPVGMVSRREFSGSVLLGEGNWGSAVDEIVGQPSAFDLWFDAIDYDGGTDEVSTTVKLVVQDDLTGTFNLTIYLLEDSVVEDQIDNRVSPPHIQDYVHRHVLRDNLNGTWGEAMITGSASAGDTLELSYTRPLAASVLEPGHCSLVAYIYDTATDEVMQVVEGHLPP